MKYRVTQGFCISAGVDVYPGAEVEMEENQGRVYVSQGRLVAVADEPEPKKTEPEKSEPEKPKK